MVMVMMIMVVAMVIMVVVMVVLPRFPDRHRLGRLAAAAGVAHRFFLFYVRSIHHNRLYPEFLTFENLQDALSA